MTKTIVALFNDQQDMDSAMNELRDVGYNPTEISIVYKDVTKSGDQAEDTAADATVGAVSGATTGALVGAGAGLLAATVLPGLGAVLLGGPIAAALGLTGTAAATVSGAATGAVAGSLIGALTNLGLSKQEANYYQSQLEEGAALIAIPVKDTGELQVSSILEYHNARDIKILGDSGHNEYSEDVQDFGSGFRQKSYAYVGTKGGSSDDEEEDELDVEEDDEEDEDEVKVKS